MIPSCKRKTEALRQRHGCSYREEVQVSSPSASQKAEHRKKRKRRGESGRETHFCLPLASAPPELLIKPPPICLLGAEQSRMERTQGLDFNPASYNSVWSQASCYWLSESCFHICNTRLSVPRVVLWELKGEGTVPRVGAGPTLMPPKCEFPHSDPVLVLERWREEQGIAPSCLGDSWFHCPGWASTAGMVLKGLWPWGSKSGYMWSPPDQLCRKTQSSHFPVNEVCSRLSIQFTFLIL